MLTLVVGLVSRLLVEGVVGLVRLLLVDRVHRLVTSEALVHRGDQVDGLGCRRGVVVVLAWSASASSAAAAAASSGRLLLLLSCGLGWLVRAATLGMPRMEALVADDVFVARIGVSCATRDCVEAVGAAAILDAGHRFVLSLHALDLRA